MYPCENSTAIRRTAGREVDVSCHQGGPTEPPPPFLNSLKHHTNIAQRGLKDWETWTSQYSCQFFGQTPAIPGMTYFLFRTPEWIFFLVRAEKKIFFRTFLLWIKPNLGFLVTFFRLIWLRTESHLLPNRSAECNYNPKLNISPSPDNRRNFFPIRSPRNPEWENLTERLASLGIRGAQLRAPLNPPVQ